MSPLRIAVLVDLLWRPDAGGHVKCWERLSEAAVRLGPEIDLAVHFQGTEDRTVELAPHVRHVLHRPVFSTARIPFLDHVPDHTDLAPWHPRLARRIETAELIHTTDAFFAQARTAENVASRLGIPLVNSVHTDTPGYTRVFMARTFERLFGAGALTRLLIDRLRLPEKGERDMLNKLARHQARCAFALVSRPEELERARSVLPAGRVGLLRRGIDRTVFHPEAGDRARLAKEFGVPEKGTLVVFAGRVNRGKKALTLAEAIRTLREGGLDVHLLCAGEGEDREAIRALLGKGATCPGVVPQSVLAAFYAAADLFVLPSEIEVNSNVVREALSCGTAVFAHADSGAGAVLKPGETGGTVAGSDPGVWAEALRPLIVDPERLAAMGGNAFAFAARHLPSWDDVLKQDLLPVWFAAAGRRACSPIAS